MFQTTNQFLWFSYGFPMVSPPQTFPNFRHSAGALPMDSGISFFTNSRSWTLLASWRSLKTEPLGSGSLTLMRRLLIFVGISLPNIWLVFFFLCSKLPTIYIYILYVYIYIKFCGPYHWLSINNDKHMNKIAYIYIIIIIIIINIYLPWIRFNLLMNYFS